MDEKEFKMRLVRLREKKGVSARDMSLSIGQNAGYINNIETGKAMPSMSAFFYICEYLDITPSEFFDTESLPISSTESATLLKSIKKLTPEQFNIVSLLIQELTKNKT